MQRDLFQRTTHLTQSLRVHTARLFMVVVLAAGFATQAAEQAPPLEPALALVVMIEGSLRNVDTFGGGIVFAREDRKILIATANHLVRSSGQTMQDILVRLNAAPETQLSATLLESHHADLDLAVLDVELPDEIAQRPLFDFRVLGESAADYTATNVYPVGYVDHRPWSRPLLASKGFWIADGMLRFESSFIGPGASGGALIEESGILVGMVLSRKPPHGEARDMHTLLGAIEELNFPAGLTLGYGYQITGQWEGNNLFQQIALEREGHQITGTVDSSDPRNFGVIQPPMARRTPEGFTTDLISLYGLSADIEGTVLGNTLQARAEGSWLRTFQSMGTGSPKMSTSEVPFAASFKGVVGTDDIEIDFVFEKGAPGGLTSGRILATRHREPKVKNWQTTLKEALEQHKE